MNSQVSVAEFSDQFTVHHINCIFQGLNSVKLFLKHLLELHCSMRELSEKTSLVATSMICLPCLMMPLLLATDLTFSSTVLINGKSTGSGKYIKTPGPCTVEIVGG